MRRQFIIGCSVFYLAAVLLIAFPVKQVPAQTPEKPRIAIKTPILGKGIDENALKQLNIAKLLTEMEKSLQATRKFEVLTRQKEFLKQIRDEQRSGNSAFFSGNAAGEGGLENVHYLVIPTVQYFRFEHISSPVPNIQNKYAGKDTGSLKVDAEILDTKTGAIKTVLVLESSFETAEKVANRTGGSPSEDRFVELAEGVAAQLADQVLDKVFPMMVLKKENDQVWINRGADGGLQRGDVLNVYRPGEALIDPYTKENLGAAERLIGSIKVVQVNPKFTILDVVSETGRELIEKGDVVRKQK